MKNYYPSLIIGGAIIITAIVFAMAFKNRNSDKDQIVVTGLGKKDFVSDLIVWNGSFSRKNYELKQAYAQLNIDRDNIRQYLISKGVDAKEMFFSSVTINKEFDYSYDNQGRTHSTFSGYSLIQNVQIESGEVDKIETVSREITELIHTGLEFNSEPPQYYYTKLAELKIEMIAAATQDAKLRAQTIAENSGGKLGKLLNANMGVFQITAQNSTEDFTWGGAYNTHSKRKTAAITMKLQYKVK